MPGVMGTRQGGRHEKTQVNQQILKWSVTVMNGDGTPQWLVPQEVLEEKIKVA